MRLVKYAVPAYSVPSCRSHLFSRVMVGSALSLISLSASAFQFDTDNSDLNVRWDNTLKYSSAWRLKDQSSKLTSGQIALNQAAGDRNFDKGLISNRLDILSELDIGYRDFGARVSGAGWYDAEYQTDNDDPTRANQRSVAFDEFTDDTRHLHGGDGELLDAFVYWNGDLADQSLSVPTALKTPPSTPPTTSTSSRR